MRIKWKEKNKVVISMCMTAPTYIHYFFLRERDTKVGWSAKREGGGDFLSWLHHCFADNKLIWVPIMNLIGHTAIQNRNN